MALHVGHVAATLDLVTEASPAGPGPRAAETPAPGAVDRWATKETLRPLVIEILDEELERYRRSKA